MGSYVSTQMIFLLALLCVCISNISGINTFGCMERERQALLQLKQSFQDPTHKLSSWKGQECCQWKGVGCDESSGHVVKLDLRTSSSYFTNYSDNLQANEVSPSLLELQHLNYLDLSGNNFNSSKIPTFFGSMNNLKYLNLSHSSFGGRIPLHFGNLTSLQVLDLQGLFGVSTHTFKWASNLLSLQYLDMNDVNCGNASDFVKVLTKLPSLSHISLSSCDLDINYFGYDPINFTFSSNLKYLDLSKNTHKRSILNYLQNMTSLEVLDLSSTFYDISSKIPTWLGDFESLVYLNLASNNYDTFEREGGLLYLINNACSLKLLDLSYNSIGQVLDPHNLNWTKCAKYNLEILNLSGNIIRGPLSSWLEQLESLKNLHLYGNLFHGPIPSSFGKFSFLELLDLSLNELNGSIPESLGRLSSLREIDLSNNELTGIIPKTMGRLSLLRKLSLSKNQLNGSLPKSLGNLVSLESLDISTNFLEGVVSEDHFANLTRLKELVINSNNFSCKVSSNWIPPFSLNLIHMGSCKVEGSHGFPKWIQTQKEATELNLSNANIIGTFPNWLHSSISYLDLSMNKISGYLPMNIGYTMPYLVTLNLGNNLLNGSIPYSICELESLDNLDLSRNKFSGKMPHCWKESQIVTVINFSYNKLLGTIPSSMGNLFSLKWLHMNNNNLNGELPSTLMNCFELELIDLGDNNFSGPLPTWIGGDSLLMIKILRLHKNMFSGSIPLNFCKLFALQILDLSGNNLSGEIPHCFGNFSGMTIEEDIPEDYTNATLEVVSPSYDIEWNKAKVSQVMKGRELEYTQILLLLDNMDLSSNKLVGVIPEELCHLSGLRGLNLSHNHLSSNIPNKIGELKSLESLDLSNNKLFGEIPQSMSNLLSLNKLDLAHNNLSGKIPTGSQLQTLDDPDIYFGNDQLCGLPLRKKCLGDDDGRKTSPTSNAHEDEDYKENRFERIWFYFVVTLGYAVGLWGVIGSLIFKRNWRLAFFGFYENIKDWILVTIQVKMGRFKKSIMKWMWIN
ncbi:hypothetical protein G4B88_026911 [Cannabis sativa]|uniref:Uncharacterized protein n=2 Tax=Cannabis sativa TaxID=3483 RepID=A0A7J6EGN0_CANSA|nr:hypothetical protein G4B88_026911 [Cannabis sativa]